MDALWDCLAIYLEVGRFLKSEVLPFLGIMAIAIPTGCVVLAEIVQGIMNGFMNVTADEWTDLSFDNEASIIVGVMFIVCSFLCGYGAEVLEGKNKVPE